MLFKKHYPCLDFLRSIAITLVLLLHFNLLFYPLPKDKFFYQFVSWGWNGVGLFFALSGFLIGGQIIEALQTNSFSFKKFYIKRFWRIAPPYYFSLIVVTVTIVAGIAKPLGNTAETTKTLLYHVFYLQNYLHLPQAQLPLYWSLAVEEQFYILVPLLLFLLWKYLRPYLSLIITGFVFLAIAMRFIHYGPDTDWLMDIRWPLHTRIDSLMLGVLAAYFFIVYNERLRNLPVSIKGIFFLCSLAALGTCLVFGKDTNSYFNTCWQFTLSSFGFAGLTLSIALSSFDKYIHGYLKKFFALVAKLSYTMYLYHLMLIYPVGYVVLRAHEDYGYTPKPIGFILGFCLYFFAVLLAAGIIYQIIDRPSMNYRKRIVKRMDSKEAP